MSAKFCRTYTMVQIVYYLFGMTHNSSAQIFPMSVLHKFLEEGIRENSFQRALQHCCVAHDISFCFFKHFENLIKKKRQHKTSMMEIEDTCIFQFMMMRKFPQKHKYDQP